MRKWIAGALCCALLLAAAGCSSGEEARIVNTFEATPAELLEEAEDVTLKTYYQLSDGTWKTEEHPYRYRLVLTGRLSNAAQDTTYTILSNTEDITFEQAWKASGLSSNTNDYFDAADAVFVGIR